MPDTPKTNLFNIKTSKNKPQKHHFCHVQKQPTIFHKFSFFSETQLLKPTFSTMSKNTFFPKKVSFLFFFCNFRWNPYFYSVSCFALFWSKKIWPKQIVCTKMRVFSPFLTQMVSGNFCKKSIFFIFHNFGWPPKRTLFFIGFFGLFPFSFFYFSVSLSPT